MNYFILWAVIVYIASVFGARRAIRDESDGLAIDVFMCLFPVVNTIIAVVFPLGRMDASWFFGKKKS